MLYWLTLLSDGGDFFNLFRYITFRAGGAFLTALIFGFLFGKPTDQRAAAQAGQGPADPRRRAGGPFRQGRHPDHGRAC